ncbi:MAG: hypothetical protein MHM6MM_004437 [Cercozoa sp. M6MM]
MKKSLSMATLTSEEQKPLVVLKVGTSSLIDDESGFALKPSALARIVEVVVAVRQRGYDVILVSSGAVGCGYRNVDMDEKPSALAKRQALAAIGQMKLLRHYDLNFASFGVVCAQVLLTSNNLTEREHHINARATFRELLHLDAVPIVNENDTVATRELRFGDNDRLAALVSGMMCADWLFLLTDVDAVYDKNPQRFTDAQRIACVHPSEDMDADLCGEEESQADEENVETNVNKDNTATDAAADVQKQKRDGEPSDSCNSNDDGHNSDDDGENEETWGTGGMESKVAGARLASSAGVTAVILSSKDPMRVIQHLEAGFGDKDLGFGTRFLPVKHSNEVLTLKPRARWLLTLKPTGSILVDDGAVKAMLTRSANLFPVGVTRVRGRFEAGEAVNVLSASTGNTIGVGLVNFCNKDLIEMRGQHYVDAEQPVYVVDARNFARTTTFESVESAVSDTDADGNVSD